MSRQRSTGARRLQRLHCDRFGSLSQHVARGLGMYDAIPAVVRERANAMASRSVFKSYIAYCSWETPVTFYSADSQTTGFA